MSHFSDPASVARYARRPAAAGAGPRGFASDDPAAVAERAPKDARVLVLGAGGGMELKVFAEGQPGWRLDGVDPGAAMLKLAEEMLGPLAAQVSLQEGYIVSAPDGPFDAASCLLTLHFLGLEERLRTLQEVRRRMKLGAPLRGRTSQLSERRKRSRALVIPLRRIRGRFRRRPRNGGNRARFHCPSTSGAVARRA